MESSHERWLITGAGGQLGSVLMRELSRSEAVVMGIASPTGSTPHDAPSIRCDITNADELARVIKAHRPSHMIHAAAVTHIQAAYDDPQRARLINAGATGRLVEFAADFAARLLHVSTDLVFDGLAAPYDESAPPQPLSVYGRTKLEGERFVLQYTNGLVARLSLMYGIPATERRTTFQEQMQSIRTNRPLRLFADEFRTPISLEDASRACLLAARSEQAGLLHIGGPERLSRLDIGRITARWLGRHDADIVAISQADAVAPERRPSDVSLKSHKFERCFGHPPGRPMADALTEFA